MLKSLTHFLVRDLLSSLPIILFLFHLCCSPNTPASSSDCSKPLPSSFSNGKVVEISDSAGVCVYYLAEDGSFPNDPSALIYYVFWNGLDCHGDTVPSGTYILKVTVYINGSPNSLTTAIYVDNENVPPDSPTGLSVEMGADSAFLIWNSVSKATSYRLYYSNGSQLDTSSPYKSCSSPSCTLSQVLNGQLYSFAVAARNGAGMSSLSNTLSLVLPMVRPLKVPVIHTVASVNCITLSWSPSNLANKYIVFYHIGGTAQIHWVDSNTVTLLNSDTIATDTYSVAINNLTSCKSYSFGVSAVNELGMSDIRLTYATPLSPSFPKPVCSFDSTGSNLVISWENAPVGYFSTIQIDSNPFAGGDRYLKYIKAVSPLQVPGIPSGIYTVYGQAADSSGNSCSNIVNATYAIIIPSINLKVAANPGEVYLSWDSTKYTDMYIIYYNAGSVLDTTAVILSTSSNNITVNGLIDQQTYIFGIRARSSYRDTTYSRLFCINATPTLHPPYSVSSEAHKAFALINAHVPAKDTTFIDYYHVYYSKGDSIDQSATMLKAQSLPCTLSNLDSNTMYCVAVSAIEGLYETPISSSCTFYTIIPKIDSAYIIQMSNYQKLMIYSTPIAGKYFLNYYFYDDLRPTWAMLLGRNHGIDSITSDVFVNPKIYGVVNYSCGRSLPSETLQVYLK